DGDPRQSGLESVEHELLVERAVVVFRHAPLVVVIAHIERIARIGPRAPMQAVGVEDRRSHFASPGQGNFAHSGLRGLSVTPPATSGVPACIASPTRSSRSMARPRAPAPLPVVPTGLS